MVLKPIPYIDIEDIKPNDISATKCAPHLEFENGSCIPLELLTEMAKAYNNYHSTDKSKHIKLYSKLDTLYPDDYKKYLLLEFKNRFDCASVGYLLEYFQISLLAGESLLGSLFIGESFNS